MNSKKKQQFFEHAIQMAKNSTIICSKHACIIVHKNNIIGKGINKYAYSDKSRLTIHAEASAIFDALRNGHKKLLSSPYTFMLVVRISFNLTNCICHSHLKIALKPSKPCCKCAPLICKYKIPTVYYTV